MSFDWLQPTPPRRRRKADSDERLDMYKDEIKARAGLYYRLGYPPSRAISRLIANADWDFEIGCGGRPAGLTDSDIKEIVKSTYLRRPTR